MISLSSKLATQFSLFLSTYIRAVCEIGQLVDHRKNVVIFGPLWNNRLEFEGAVLSFAYVLIVVQVNALLVAAHASQCAFEQSSGWEVAECIVHCIERCDLFA